MWFHTNSPCHVLQQQQFIHSFFRYLHLTLFPQDGSYVGIVALEGSCSMAGLVAGS